MRQSLKLLTSYRCCVLINKYIFSLSSTELVWRKYCSFLLPVALVIKRAGPPRLVVYPEVPVMSYIGVLKRLSRALFLFRVPRFLV
jgi:hypothetical protein